MRAYKLPQELDYDLGVLAEPLAVGTHAVRLANIKKGSTCVVLGSGTVGMLAGVAAQEAGAGRVYCTDLNRFRLQLPRGSACIDQGDEVSVEEMVKSFTPDGADVVLVAFTSSQAFGQALKLVKRGGTIIVIALFTDPVAIDMNTLQGNEINLKGSHIYTREDFESAIRILVKRKRTYEKRFTHHVSLDGSAARLKCRRPKQYCR